MHSHQIDALRSFDTCTIANAIEEFGLRLRNEGYSLPGLHCMTGSTSTVVGFAVMMAFTAVAST